MIAVGAAGALRARAAAPARRSERRQPAGDLHSADRDRTPRPSPAAIVEGARAARREARARDLHERPGRAAGARSRSRATRFPSRRPIALARAVDVRRVARAAARERSRRFRDLDVDRRARRRSTRALERGGGWLDPGEGDRLLAAFGIPVAPRASPRTDAEAAAAARSSGFPSRSKAVGPAILHKTEVGGVRLGLADEAAVAAACRDMTAPPRRGPDRSSSSSRWCRAASR